MPLANGEAELDAALGLLGPYTVATVTVTSGGNLNQVGTVTFTDSTTNITLGTVWSASKGTQSCLGRWGYDAQIWA